MLNFLFVLLHDIGLLYCYLFYQTLKHFIIFFSKGLCSIQGVFSHLQSRAQLTVDRHKLLASGLNVSVADGRLALLLSHSPPASNQTGTQPRHVTTLTAQFKGQILLTAGFNMCAIAPF